MTDKSPPDGAASDLLNKDRISIPVDLSTLNSCWIAAANLFWRIEKRHGAKAAQHIFDGFTKYGWLKRVKDTELNVMLESVERMGWNQQQLAGFLAGPGANESEVDAMRKRIEQAIKKCRRK